MTEYKPISNKILKLKGSHKYDAAYDAFETTMQRCVLEPKNRYDPLAIKVINDERKTIGYLAAGSEYREKVREAIESGHDVYAVIVENTLDDDYGYIKARFVMKE